MKVIVIVIIIVLIVGVVVMGLLYLQKNNDLTLRNTELFVSNNNLMNKTNELTQSQSRVADLEKNVSSLETNVSTLENNVSSLQENLDEQKIKVSTLTLEKTTVMTSLTELQTDFDTVNMELNSIKAIYPPRDFSSLSALQTWVNKHLQPRGSYLDDTFRAALRVQDDALKDGYLISVMYDEDDTDPDYGWVYCATLVNGELYYWHPAVGTIHTDYTWLAR